jgi:hypothetical protein
VRRSPSECREARRGAVGEHTKGVHGVLVEAADEVSSAFLEEQTVVAVAVVVGGASGFHFAE